MTNHQRIRTQRPAIYRAIESTPAIVAFYIAALLVVIGANLENFA